MKRKMGLFFPSAFLTATIFFISFSEVDLWFSSFFYDQAAGFYLADSFLCKFIYYSLEIVSFSLVTALFLTYLYSWIRKKSFFNFSRKHIIYCLAVLAIGPGLIVNVVLKDNLGRARPKEIIQFGGTASFSPAFILSDECKRNCSFVSGHASMGFYLIVFGFVFKRRKLFFTLSLAYGTSVGLVRIIQGGHFLSDVVFAFFFTYSTAAILYRLMFHGKEEIC